MKTPLETIVQWLDGRMESQHLGNRSYHLMNDRRFLTIAYGPTVVPLLCGHPTGIEKLAA